MFLTSCCKTQNELFPWKKTEAKVSMNEVIKSSVKYSNKYHNYLPNSRPLSRHDLSTRALSSRILVSVIQSRSQFSLTDDAGAGVGAWLGPRRGSGPLLSISGDQLSPRANTTSSRSFSGNIVTHFALAHVNCIAHSNDWDPTIYDVFMSHTTCHKLITATHFPVKRKFCFIM